METVNGLNGLNGYFWWTRRGGVYLRPGGWRLKTVNGLNGLNVSTDLTDETEEFTAD